MKKRMVSILLVAALLSSLTISFAAEARIANYKPILSFDGTTANCYIRISAFGKEITATLELYCGNSRVARWSDAATSYLVMDEDQSVTPGQTYTLEVSGTIDGVPFTGSPITATCPK